MFRLLHFALLSVPCLLFGQKQEEVIDKISLHQQYSISGDVTYTSTYWNLDLRDTIKGDWTKKVYENRQKIRTDTSVKTRRLRWYRDMVTGKTLFILSYDSSLYFSDGKAVYYASSSSQRNRYPSNASEVQHLLPPLGVRLYPLVPKHAGLRELTKDIPALYEVYPDSLWFDSAHLTFHFRRSTTDEKYPWNDNSYAMQAVTDTNGMMKQWSTCNFSAMNGD